MHLWMVCVWRADGAGVYSRRLKMNLSVVASQRKEIKRLSDINAELIEALQSLLATQILPEFHAEKFRKVVSKALGQ